ncbi:DUF3152 domain-containing protein [Streptomyces sasae]|uniref:DUF3152 domain-containing protein n=1 Tax=Streptomyces sasae TaxID=1266772 RepID=UPI00292E763A|nr:DUF3152 domain-containing protein [Streptomyces sasae]
MSENNPALRPAAHAASRRRSRSHARRRRRHTHRNGVLGLSAVAAFLVCTGIAMHTSTPSGAGVPHTAVDRPTPAVTPVHTTSHPAAPSPSAHPPSPSASSSAPPSVSSSASSSTWFPERGNGDFTRAAGGTKVFGTGKLLRYAVDVEGGLGQDPGKFARQVDTVLDDTKRGWAAGGAWSFQRVASGPVDFTVHLASPGTTDTLCAKYGLDTGGWVNCSGGDDVVINVKRWLLLTQYYRGEPGLYHALAVNHEVGHRLGHNHVGCPGPGKPAPVMMQQIKGLHGCVINGWPYDGHGLLITGPAAS